MEWKEIKFEWEFKVLGTKNCMKAIEFDENIGLKQVFLNTHLGYSLNLTFDCHRHVMGAYLLLAKV